MTTNVVKTGDTFILPPGPLHATRLVDGTYVAVVAIFPPDYDGTQPLTWGVQHYAADGTLLGEPVTAFYDGAESKLVSSKITAFSDGSYEVTARFDGYDFDFHSFIGSFGIFQHYSADGARLSDNATNGMPESALYGAPQAVELDSGDVLTIATWDGSLTGQFHDLQIYSPTGDPVGNTTRLMISDDYLSAGFSDVSAAATDEGYAVAWSQLVDGVKVVEAQLFNAAGVAIADAFQIFTAGNGSPGVLAIQRLDAGFVVVGQSIGVPTVQAYSSTGVAIGEAAQLTDGTAPISSVHVAELSDGGFIVVWSAPDSDGNDVLARRFDAGGHALGFAFQVNTYAAGHHQTEDVEATVGGGFIVTWQGDGDHGMGTYETAFPAAKYISTDNHLFGTAGNDRLNGAAGADTLAAGVGNDTYVVDNAGDVVQELTNAGIDIIVASISFSLTSDVENLTLTGAASIDGLGNALDNRIRGNNAANRLSGVEGNDVLSGLGGNDVLNGGSGMDRMYGGAGDDTYYADNAGDKVVETAAGDGMDTVRASVSFKLGAFVENLILLGTEDLRGLGNDLANILGGNGGANTLYGFGGNDRIDGGAGADRMIGGTGDDTYIVDTTGDRVYETAGEGNDRVYSSVSFAINSQSIEYVILTGTADTYAYGDSRAERLLGNSGANIIKGGSGDDSLNGGDGADNLFGGYGADIFTFGLASGTDTVSDFSAAEHDRLDLHAYSAGVANGGGVTLAQSGDDTVIDLGGGNTITVLHTTATDLISHIIW